MKNNVFWVIFLAVLAVVIWRLPIPGLFEELAASLIAVADFIILAATRAKQVQDATALLTPNTTPQSR